MLAVLIILCVLVVTFVYNTRRVEKNIDREPAGPATGWAIGFPMLLSSVGALFVCWWLVWSHQNLSFDAAAERFVLTGLLLYLGPLVIGSMLNISKKKRRHGRNEDTNI